MSVIKQMDPLLANKIAAGEVVERCASVVKELVENSIDAKSTEIKIELIESGTKEMKITDNGTGMEKEDAVLAFQRHATSKLEKEEDLYHLHTLGFRGEALASIASVSDITLKTSTGDVGTIVETGGGKLVSVASGDARKGTMISVRNLFYNTPARLKHMKSLYTELASITDYVNKIAMSHPDIKFVLSNNGNILLNTDGSGQLLKTIRFVYGTELVKKMVEVVGSNDDYHVYGYLTLPEVHRSTRTHMITMVNGRVVRNMDLNRVMKDHYNRYQPENRYPVIVLQIEVDPTLVDVNVHPTKMDIKFSKMEELEQLLGNLIDQSLGNKTLIPRIEKREIPQYQEQILTLNRVSEPETPYQINLDFTVPKETKEEVIDPDMEDKIEMVLAEDKKERMPELYPVGLVHGTYIICQNELGMYLIDQHAAKERINYEIYKNRLENPHPESISLLFPITLEYTNNETILLKENLDFLRSMGFEVEEFGIQSFVVKSHPTWLPKNQEEEAIRMIFDLVLQKEKDFQIGIFRDHLAKTVSCKMSIKANQNITNAEMEQLITDLRNCENPFNCPHGRPTTIFYSNYDLEKLFKRSGF